eukprot:jgi/Picsp_1/5082/NSC_02445-R1_---NA---
MSFGHLVLYITHVVLWNVKYASGGLQPVRRLPQQCATFIPTLCAISSSKIRKAHCPSCQFDVEYLFRCPLVAAGYYAYRTGQSEGGFCRNIATASSSRQPVPCGSRCCRTDHEGQFIRDEDSSTKYASESESYSSSLLSSLDPDPPLLRFQPSDSQCRYMDINRGQILNLFSSHSHSNSLVVIGDSTMRQLYLSLIALMRGQTRFIDHHVHTHIQYFVCREVDFLRLSANSSGKKTSPFDSCFLRSIIPTFFGMKVGPGKIDAERILKECDADPLQLNYLQAPLFMAQADMLSRYVSSMNKTIGKPVVVFSIGYWQTGGEVPHTYLNTLTKLEESVSRFVYIGVPTIKVSNKTEKDNINRRNEFMKGWIEARGPKYLYIDFNLLAVAKDAPKGTKGSKHYACWIEWSKSIFPFGAVDNPAGTSQIYGDVSKIHPDLEGECADPMGKAVWTVLLNALYDKSGS